VGAHTSSGIPGLDRCFAGANALAPDLMTGEERLSEVARLLALGFLRLRARRRQEKANDPNHLRSLGLDFDAEGRVCDTDTHADRERRP
jgi:hypothetical protein